MPPRDIQLYADVAAVKVKQDEFCERFDDFRDVHKADIGRIEASLLHLDSCLDRLNKQVAFSHGRATVLSMGTGAVVAAAVSYLFSKL